MFIFYDDAPKTGSYFPPKDNADATKHYLTHYGNSLYLTWMLNHKETTALEKEQATKELEIAERRMNFWKGHFNFDMARATDGTIKLKRQWK